MYCDSCILLKLLTPEDDSAFFERELRDRPLGSSELAWTEVDSALLARERAGRRLPAERRRAWELFQHWVDDELLVLHPLNRTSLRQAAQQLEQCHPAVPLRPLDALHLAACDLTQDFPLCTTDERLRQAAEMLRIPLLPERPNQPVPR